MSLTGKKLFLLEDDPVNFSIILTLLRKHGAHVAHDYWGDTTLQQMRTAYGEYDLILLDLMLPGKVSGYDVFDAIKAVPELSDIPVVAVSAADPDVEIPKTRSKGFSGFISKPINRRNFPGQLIAILKGESVWE